MDPQTEIEARLEGILCYLWGAFEAGRKMNSATKGSERELFIAGFLSQVFPPHYRLSGGDIMDSYGNYSGQVDIVLEFPRGFSFPVYTNGPRLFLAESVAAVIEVKSNLKDQWQQVLKQAEDLSKVRRCFQPQHLKELAEKMRDGTVKLYSSRNPEDVARDLEAYTYVPGRAEDHIPFYVVGFEGWKDADALRMKLKPGMIDAIFVIESRCFVSQTATLSGTSSLMAFLELLEQEVLRKAIPMPVLVRYLHFLRKPDTSVTLEVDKRE